MSQKRPELGLPDDPEALLGQFPASFDTQDDILQGQHTIAAALLHGSLSPQRAKDINNVLSAASKTIAMRDTVKANANRPQITNTYQVTTGVMAVGAPALPGEDPFIDALGPVTPPQVPLALSEPLVIDEDHTDEPAPPVTTPQISAKGELREGRSALLQSLQGRRT